MSFLFKRKTPAELVKSTQKQILEIVETKTADKEPKKNLSKITENLAQIKVLLYGDPDNNAPAKQENIDALAAAITDPSETLLLLLIEHMISLEFESRKEVLHIFTFLLRHKKEEMNNYVKQHPELITSLVMGYSTSEVALNTGSILREALRHEEISQMFLQSQSDMDLLIGYLQLSIFDVASDAFATLQLLLTKHKKLVAKYLEAEFEPFFTKYQQLLNADTYVTKRLALKLLAELLLSRDNFTIMMRYIGVADHLKTIMNLLRGTTKTIQLEAFHVFKIFVANPKKTDPIRDILYRNRIKLIEFLNRFQKDKEDEQFNDEKQILLAALQEITPSAAYAANLAAAAAASANATAGAAGAAGTGAAQTVPVTAPTANSPQTASPSSADPSVQSPESTASGAGAP